MEDSSKMKPRRIGVFRTNHIGAALGLHVGTIRRAIKRGGLAAVKVNGRWVVAEQALRDYLGLRDDQPLVGLLEVLAALQRRTLGAELRHILDTRPEDLGFRPLSRREKSALFGPPVYESALPD